MHARLLTVAALAFAPALFAAPAHAVSPNWCSVTSGHLTITSTEAYAETAVLVGIDGSQGDADVVAVSSPSDPVCINGGGQQPRLIDLTDITIVNQYGGPITVNVSRPFTGASGLVPITVSQYTIPGSDAGLKVSAQNSVTNRDWRVVPDTLPKLSLDGDLVADLTISNSPGTNHTDKLTLATGDGNDVVDLGQETLPTTWPVKTQIATFYGNDTVLGGPELDLVEPGWDQDTVDLGPEADPFAGPSGGGDIVTISPDSARDTILGDGVYGGGLVYLAGEDLVLMPNFDEAVDPTFHSGTFDEISSGVGDRIGGFRSYTGGHGSDYFVAPGPDASHPNPAAPSFDGGDGGLDTLDLSQLAFSASVGPFQGAGAPDQLAYPNQTIGAIQHVHTIVGTPYTDYFQVSSDDLVIRPGLGDDQVFSNGKRTIVAAEATPDGADVFDTNDGKGTWDYTARPTAVSVTLDGDANDGDVQAGEGDQVSGSDVYRVLLGQGSDYFAGDSTATLVMGNMGNDTLLGRGGGDSLEGGEGTDLLVGGSGDDALNGGPGNDTLDGSAGDDDELGEDGNDTFKQGSAGDNGSDLLRGGGDSDTVTYLGRTAGVSLSINNAYDDGAAGEYDRIGTDIETLVGTDAADSLTGSSGANTLRGQGGNDTLRGLGGNDVLFGDTGNDTFVEDAVANGADQFNGGAGVDTTSYADRTAAVSVVIDGTANDGAALEADLVKPDVENLVGGKGADVLRGSATANSITGGLGADKLYGLAGNDLIYAKDGVKDLVVDGGTGTDLARLDGTDPKVSIEGSA